MIPRTASGRVARTGRGQALAEFALVFPIFMLVMFGIIVSGMYIFYTQQVTNAAREAARFAAVHSATAQCPTVSWLDPAVSGLPIGSYARCDPPEDGWPDMTAASKGLVWGAADADLGLSACWSGFIGPSGSHDAPPEQGSPPVANTWDSCTIGGLDPHRDLGSIPCPQMTASSDDTGSSLPGNHVTVYACFRWQPPMHGVLFLPETIVIRAAVTEVVQRQQ